MGKKTIVELYDYVKDILCKTENLKAVYIGKTSSEESAEKRHQDKYDNTQEIAFGLPKTISKAEDYLIKNLKKELSCIINIDNKKEGSAGNPNADILYISWVVKYDNADQLFDPDFNEEPFELIDNN